MDNIIGVTGNNEPITEEMMAEAKKKLDEAIENGDFELGKSCDRNDPDCESCQ